MEILVVIVAFWLLLVGAYGGITLISTRNRQNRRRQVETTPRIRAERGETAPLGGLFSEVDMLRAQVEHLRTEVVALSETASTRHERSRTRRYQTGVYADLPRMLRRHVKEARNERHPLGI